MLLSADQPSDTGSRGSRHTNPGPRAQRGSRAAPTSRKGCWDRKEGKWREVDGVGCSRDTRRWAGEEVDGVQGPQRSRSFGQSCVHLWSPSSSESGVEIHGYHHHRELGGQMRRLGTLGQNPRLPPNPHPHPHPQDTHSSLPHSPQVPHLSQSTSRLQSQTTICPTCSCQWHGRCARSNPGEEDSRSS